MDIDFKQIETLKEMQKVKERNECLVCEIVVPYNKDIQSTIYGQGNEVSTIAMIKTLEMMAQDLKKDLKEGLSNGVKELKTSLSDLLGKNRWRR